MYNKQGNQVMKYKVQVWFRYYSNGQSEKDSEIEEVEADDEKQAKRKAADLYAEKRVIPYKTEIIL